jgi:hypothetical protein
MNKFIIVSTSNLSLLLALISALYYGCYHVSVNSFRYTTPVVMKRIILQKRSTFISPQRIRPSLSTDIQLNSVTCKKTSNLSDRNSLSNMILDRRQWFMTSAIVIGLTKPIPSCNAVELLPDAAQRQEPVVDPLVSFGESLSKTSYTNNIVPVQQSSSLSSSSSWPHNAAHPLPIPDQDTSLLPLPPPTIDEVIQQSKMKKRINPTTHG